MESDITSKYVSCLLKSLCSSIFEEYNLSPIQFGIPNSRPRYYLIATRKEDTSKYESNLRQSIEDVEKCEMSIIGEYLSDEADATYLPLEVVSNTAISIVDSSFTSSTCFTKSYTQYLVGCGSYFRDSNGVRPFSPREVSSLLSFPPTFSWPVNISKKQVYRALGNSVNVVVVSKLLERLLSISI